MSHHVLDVRGLDEAESSPLHEGHAATRQFQLEIEGVKAGAKENRHLRERHPFFVEFEQSLAHEEALPSFVGRRHEHRRIPASPAGE